MGSHRRKNMGRRRRDLLRTIAAQKDYIATCERAISDLCNDNDRLKIKCGEVDAPPLDDTVIMPVIVDLEPPTHTIPIVLPDGTVLRTESGTRRPSWARED